MLAAVLGAENTPLLRPAQSQQRLGIAEHQPGREFGVERRFPGVQQLYHPGRAKIVSQPAHSDFTCPNASDSTRRLLTHSGP